MKAQKTSVSRKVASVFASALLAALLVPAAAFATPSSATDVEDSVFTFSGLEDGDTISAYLIADADIDATNNLTWDLIPGLPSAYDSIEKISAVASDGYSFTERTDAQNAASAMADAALAGGVYASETAAGGQAQLTLGSGYYLVRVSNATNATRIYQNMLVDVAPEIDATTGQYIPHSDPAPVVKSSDVTVSKSVAGAVAPSPDTYSVGDVVPFVIETAIPSYPADATTASFVISDAPTIGLEIDTTSIVVSDTAGPLTAGDEYTITATADGFTITFANVYLLANPSEPITVEYGALLTPAALDVVTGLTENTATVTFTPNPYDADPSSLSDIDGVEDVQTYGYCFQKVDENGAPLPGAKFEVTLPNGVVLESTSDANGYVWFSGLAAGEYTAIETIVPAGYVKAPNQIFTLDSTVCVDDNPATAAVTETNFLVNPNGVVDPYQSVLPITGGAGTLALTIIGIALVAGGIFVFARSRRVAQH